MKRTQLLLADLLVAIAVATIATPAFAKLPMPPETPESKAKAEEAAAKAAAAAKREAEDLARYQDKAAAHYRERQAK
jgi:hypothetical protein